MNKKWIEVCLETYKTNEELITNYLYEIGCEGLKIENYDDFLFFKEHKENWVILDENLYSPDNGMIKIYAYFKDDNINKFNEIIRYKLKCNFKFDLSIIYINYLKEIDWQKEWKKNFKPFEVGKNFVIKPSWCTYDNFSNKKIVEIDPGMAFGTGTHETTSLCIDALEMINIKDKIIYDIGCGSGILSICSSKLGAKKIYAIDIDKDAINVCLKNVENNNIENIEIINSDLFNNIIDIEKADIIIANILPNILDELYKNIKKYMKENAIIISSGIIKSKKNFIIKRLEEEGFKNLFNLEKGEWIAQLAKK